MNMLRHDWIIRLPEDEFDDHEDEDDIAKEKVMKGNETALAIHPLPHHLGCGDSINSDLFPETDPIAILEKSILSR